MDSLIESPEIPSLKKNERDRKGAAVPLLGRGASSSGILGAGRLADGLSNLFGSSWLGGMFASNLGPSLALGCMLLAGTAAVGAGLAIFGRVSPQGSSSMAMRPMLDGVGASGLRIHRPTDRSLDYVSQANHGQIAPEQDPTAVQPPQNGSSQPETVQRGGAQDSGQGRQGLDGTRGKIGRLTSGTDANTMAGWKLGSNEGRLKPMDGFGAQSNFAGSLGNPSPKFNANLSKLTRFSAPTSGYTAGRKSFIQGSSKRAMGQLKLARNMSAQGAAAPGDEARRRYAADAFDQGKTQGGNLSGLPQIGSGMVSPTSNGAPNLMSGGGPSAGAGQNVTPYQGLLAQAAQMASKASMLKIISVILIAAGIALIASGGFWGYALGAALIAAGGMMFMEAQQLKNQASQIASQIQQQFGQTGQAQTVQDCAAQAAANGTSVQNCNSATGSQIKGTLNDTSAGQAARNEGAATYTLGNGGPIDNTAGNSPKR